MIDILVQPCLDQRPAERFSQRLLRGQAAEPMRIITGKLRSDSAATRTIFPNVTTDRYAKNRAEVFRQLASGRRQMQRFESAKHAQRFLSLHDAIQNVFRVGRHHSGRAISGCCDRAFNLAGSETIA